MGFAEDNYENAVIELFRDSLGYSYIYGPDVERDYRLPLYMEELRPALERINAKLPTAAIQAAIEKLQRFETGSLLQIRFSQTICKMVLKFPISIKEKHGLASFIWLILRMSIIIALQLLINGPSWKKAISALMSLSF